MHNCYKNIEQNGEKKKRFRAIDILADRWVWLLKCDDQQFLKENWRWHLTTQPNVFLLNVLFRSSSKNKGWLGGSGARFERVHMHKSFRNGVCVSVCECSCVCQASVSVLLAPGSPAQTKLPVRGLTSPTPQSTIHRGQPGHAVRLLWYVTLASLSLFSLYLFHCGSFYASVPSYFVQLFYNGRQRRLWGQRCPMSPSGASYCCSLLTLHTASHARTRKRKARHI